ncbi:MAG: hypothetical protein FJ298_00210 [Planctomycetes bacterium]|nr:hypothetical protein [Planctomycetota bacterium]
MDVTALEHLPTPLLLVRLDRVRANLARMEELLAAHGGLARWRPHVKTAKVPQVLDLLLDRGLRRFKCATTREARVLLELAERRGASIDLLVAFAHRGANLARVVELAQRHPRQRVSMLSEDAAHARSLREHSLGVFIDLDPHMGRSGIALDQRARIREVALAAETALRGWHAYEGHVRAPTAPQRRAACAPLFDALADLALSLGSREHETITSGTPTFVEALEHRGLAALQHSISPGIVVYWDHNSAALGLAGFRCAASVLTRVISRPRSDRVTVDAGSKSIDASVSDPCVQVAGRPELVATRPSEEHLPLDVRSLAPPQLGDLLELEPRHVCPMVNLAERCALLEGERLLTIASVCARAHGD